MLLLPGCPHFLQGHEVSLCKFDLLLLCEVQGFYSLEIFIDIILSSTCQLALDYFQNLPLIIGQLVAILSKLILAGGV